MNMTEDIMRKFKMVQLTDFEKLAFYPFIDFFDVYCDEMNSGNIIWRN